MPDLVDHRGRPVRIGQKLGAGGEGAVFEISTAAQFVAKVYHDKPDPAKAEKLAAMAALASANKRLVEIAAWPVATLHERAGGPVVGIGMPRVAGGREIHDLYGPSFRKIHFPNADWRFLLHVARRCVGAFDELHRAGIVLGDVNQGNVLVFPDGRIRLIDCDSFQITNGGKQFLCEVGVSHFTPPELQSADFRKTVRTPNHDRFGLAVLIFHLLFAGRHPFAGKFLGSGDPPSIEQAITDRKFAYASWASRVQMAPPPHVPTLAIVPPEFARLFERAFGPGAEVSGARPSAADWAAAIDALLASLKRCKQSPGHFFAANGASCPWCAIESKGGPDYFISVTIKANIAGRVFDIARFWAEIEATNKTINRQPPEITGLPAPPNWTPATVSWAPAVAPRPPRPLLLPEDMEDRRNLQRIVGFMAAVSAATLPIGIFATFWLLTAGLLTIVFAVWWLGMVVTSPLWRYRHDRLTNFARYGRQKANAMAAHAAAKAELKQATDAVTAAGHARWWAEQELRAQAKDAWYKAQGEVVTRQEACYRELVKLRDTYVRLNEEKKAAIAELGKTVKERSINAQLRSIFIRDHKISGIGPARLATLDAYGIETAYDIDSRVMNIPGIGTMLQAELFAWRNGIAAGLRPSSTVPKSDIDAVEAKFAQKRLMMERQLHEQAKKLKQLAGMATGTVKPPPVDDKPYRRALSVEIDAIAAEAEAAKRQAQAAIAEAEAIAAAAQAEAEIAGLPSLMEVVFPRRRAS